MTNFKDKETVLIKCHICGGTMKLLKTSLPFKVYPTMTVIINNLPVIQCECCNAYIIDDPILKRVDEILDSVNADANLEVIEYYE